MKGTILMSGLLGFAAIFGAALWYYQVYAFYEVAETDDFDMRLTLVMSGEPDSIPADNFTILDADTSPLKFRACFKVVNSVPMMTETYVIYDDPTPLQPPSWFECFDAGKLADDLGSGAAMAFLSEKDITNGVDRVVAVYDDGRAFAWHQLNDKFAD